MASFEKIITCNDVILKNKYGIFSKRELENQLKEGHLTVKELGSIYGLLEYQIVHILRLLDIDYRNNLNDTRVLNAEIDASLHQVLLGTLLGDSYLRENYYSVGHSISQYDYCYHIAERLHSFVASIGDFNTKAKTKKAIYFWTYRHKVFQSYIYRFYSHGISKKYFTVDSAYDLNSEGLAYWYMDDGKYRKYGAYLCIGDISMKEAEILMELLKRNFLLSVSLHKWDKNSNAIYIQAKSCPHFFNLISPYIIPSMDYKIGKTARTVVAFNRDLIVSRHINLCSKVKRNVRYFGDKEIERRVLEECSFFNTKEEYIENTRKLINQNRIISRKVERNLTKDNLLKLFEEGLTDQQIAERFGVGRNKIGFLRRSYGIESLRSRRKRK